MDQWYYNQTWPGLDCYATNCHDYNLTANLTLFPDGIMPVREATGWYFLAQTDPWSFDNAYSTVLGYEFAKNKTIWTGVPNTNPSNKFWNYFFSINNKDTWGLIGFERDWMSYITSNMEIIHNNTEFGRNWLIGLGQGANNHGMGGVQMCMSYPRHILTSALSPSFTQARVSGDYHPGSSQWKIGETAIFTSALDIQPSKDTYWTNNTKQTTGMRNRCSNGCVEPHYRLISHIVALSNGPNYSGDRLGTENVTLIMMCCNSDGLLLRPDVSATAMDNVILQRAKLGEQSKQVNGELYSSYSLIDGKFMYYYVLAALIQGNNNHMLELKDLAFYTNQTLMTENYLVYEANTTDKYVEVNGGSALTVNVCNAFDFQYYTMVPIINGYNVDQWYLAGEINKFIKVSNQRFNTINLNNNGSVSVEIQGLQNENVTVAFVNGKTKMQIVVICQIKDSSGKATVYAPQGYCD